MAPAAPLEYNYSSHWLSRAIESDRPVAVDSPALSSVITFGTPINLIFVPYLYLRADELSARFLFAIALTVVTLNLGPYMIWYYDERVLPQFIDRAQELLPEERLVELAERYDGYFSTGYWPLAIVLMPLFAAAFVRTTDFLVRVGVFEAGGPYQYLLFATILWTGYLAGVGFNGVVTTLRFIGQIADEELTIDPLHPDKLGGLSAVGYYAIRTTVAFSFGSLYIPLAYQFITLSRSAMLVEVLVGLYALFLLLSFVVPTVKVNRRADELRSATLDELRGRYQAVKAELSAEGQVESEGDGRLAELILERQAQRIRNEYEDYKQVRLYPMEIQILARLAGSVLLPLAFLLLEVTLSRVL